MLWTKLHPPSVRGDQITRPRLIAELEDGLRGKLTLVSAQAGYGKTTLLADWTARRHFRVAWVSLDPGDNTLERFLAHVIHALQAVYPGLGEATLAMLQARELPLDDLLISLANDLAAGLERAGVLSEPALLVLDDYHHIDDTAIHRAVTFLLDHAPARFHLTISARTNPPLALARLRGRNQLTEIGEQELRFTLAEAAAFLKQTMGLALAPEDIASLEARTEGWVAGLQLAALSMRGRADPGNFVRQFSGSHRHILDYLTDEVLNRQPIDIQHFLLQTSILDRLTASLCAAVTRRQDSQVILERLERDHLFVVPLDDERRCYRYHQLFSDQLRYRLQATMPEKVSELHLLACEWHAAQGRLYEAIGHALAAKSYDRAVELIEAADPTLAMRGEVTTLLSWLDAFPEQVVRAHPRLSLSYAWANFVSTNIDGIAPHLGHVYQSLGLAGAGTQEQAENLSPQEREYLGEALALSALAATYRGDEYQAVTLARQAFEILPKEAIVPRIVVNLAMGDAYRDADNVAAASQAYTQAIGMSQSIGNSLGAMVMANDLARLQRSQGRLHLAANTYRQVLEWGQSRLRPHYAVGQALVGYGDILREWNQLQAAEQHLQEGVRQCERGGYRRYQIFGQATLAHVRLAQNALDGMLAAIRRSRELALAAGVGRDIALVEALQARLWLGRPEARLAEALAWAEKAEVTVADQPTLLREFEHLSLVRVLIAQAAQQRDQRALGGALGLSSRLLARAEKSGRLNSVIEILALQSIIHHLNGEIPKAMVAIERSLALAEPEGYVRLFVDEGLLMAQVLRHASSRRILPTYVSALLAEFGEHPKADGVAPRLLAEPLSPREIEVLHLLSAGLSNREIGEALVISPGTVNTHTRKIYEKLGVGNRTQAVARARELKLL